MPLVEPVLPEDEPIEEPLPVLPEVDGVDEVSVLLEPVADGEELELEPVPLDEPVPDAPMLELELGELLPDELVDGEAPIVDELLGVLVVAPVDGEVVDEPVELVPEPAVSPPVLGAVELLLLLAPELPAEPPEVPPAAPPPVWATA